MTLLPIKRGAGVTLTGRVTGSSRSIDNFAGAGDLTGLRVYDVRATGLVRGFASILNDSSDIRIERSYLECVKSADAGNFATGIAFGGTAHKVTLQDLTVVGAGQLPGAQAYANGDTIAVEEGCYGFKIVRVISIDATDASADIKGRDCTLMQHVAIGGRFGPRLWTGGDHGDVYCTGQAKAAVHICPWVGHRTRQTFVIDHLYARDCPVALLVQTVPGAIPPRVVIRSSDIDPGMRKVDVIGAAPEVIWG